MSKASDLISPVQVGEVLAGRFRVDRIIGGGAMGVVAAARHLELDQRVAIKLVRRDVLDNAKAVQRLLVEAKATAKLKSEYVPRIFDVGKLDNGCPFIAMEYLRGVSLGKRLEQAGPIPLQQAVHFVLQACIGIAEAHAHGIVHRDIKPDNLFVIVGPDGRDQIKVLDFGISKILQQFSPVSSSPTQTLTGTQMTVGSPLYASPEQFGNARHVDARADVWGLGVTLFELISGTVPFAGDTVHEIVQSVFKSPPRVLSSLVKGVPVGLDEVIGRCLQLERDQRYATVSDFARALARFGPRGSENLAMRAERVALATSEAISSEPEDRSVDPRATTENERAGPDTPTRVLAARKLSTEMTERWLHGRYRILLQLGEGGTARVELGCVEGPGHVSKLVVLKTLKEHLAKNANYRKMFLAEARLSARLNHPNIVRVNDVLSEGDVTTIVMEYLEGKTLAEIVGRARDELPLVLGLKIISQVLSGLHHAHEFADSDGTPRPIIHRDVSPPNVFVTYTGHVKILDFGLAKVAGAQGNTRVGEMKGKLRYISPEQVRGEPDIDCRTDIYAAGVMLWEMATGSPLWNGVSDLEVLERAQSGEIRKPREVNPQVPEALERICMKALATDRRARYQTALELEADVEAVISELGPVRDKDIAAFLMKHFGQERAEQQRFVDAQLRDASTPGGSSRETPGAQTLRARQTPANAWTRRRRSRTGLLALSGVSLLIAIGTVLALTSFRINRDRQPMPAAAASVNANPIHTPNLEPLAPEPARMIELRINASPAHAKLVLDGKELSRNPYRGPAPADGQSHRLRVQADGFLPEDRIIVFERDLDVVVALKTDTKVQTPPRTRRTVRSVRRKPAAPKPAASASQLDCTPPYSLDSNGIKRFKPGCL